MDHPGADESHRRSRRWEKTHQNCKAVYRGVDPKLAWQVKVLAGKYDTAVGQVAGTLIEYALRSHERGDWDLFPRPDSSHRRMTLSPAKPARRVGYGWRVVTTWRNFPPGLKQELAALASQDGLNVPAGELVSALLRFGLHCHACGLLRLDPEDDPGFHEQPA